jgi:putative tryptophan/tyrosine transport system substrate-binding protein
MRRRELIGGIAALALQPLAVRAQQASGSARKIGLLMSTGDDNVQGRQQLESFRDALERSGWSDRRNLSFVVRWSGGEPALANRYANELVALSPDLIVAGSTIGLEAARSATKDIPILFVAVSDPVAAGYVDSLAKPGGHITGFSSYSLEAGGKWLEIIKEAVPSVTNVGVMIDPDYAAYMARWRAMEKLGPAFGVSLGLVEIRSGAEIEKAISDFAGKPERAMIVFSSALTTANSGLIIEAAKRHRLPVIYPFASFVRQGGLMSYGTDTLDLFRKAASYADRLLKGEKPGSLPVQEPTKFELAINLKTARELALTVPPSLLARADEVIE